MSEALKGWIRHFKACEPNAIEALGHDNYYALIHDLEEAIKPTTQAELAGAWLPIESDEWIEGERVVCATWFGDGVIDAEICGIREYALMHQYTHFLPNKYLPLPPQLQSEKGE